MAIQLEVITFWTLEKQIILKIDYFSFVICGAIVVMQIRCWYSDWIGKKSLKDPTGSYRNCYYNDCDLTFAIRCTYSRGFEFQLDVGFKNHIFFHEIFHIHLSSMKFNIMPGFSTLFLTAAAAFVSSSNNNRTTNTTTSPPLYRLQHHIKPTISLSLSPETRNRTAYRWSLRLFDLIDEKADRCYCPNPLTSLVRRFWLNDLGYQYNLFYEYILWYYLGFAGMIGGSSGVSSRCYAVFMLPIDLFFKNKVFSNLDVEFDKLFVICGII